MGRAGKALRQILEAYEISQYQLAAKMEIDRSNISRWVSEERDPSAEAVYAIKQALQELNRQAADEFVRLYLGNGGKKN
ncbi:MAG: helix-turn-helix transcriptional regulator [Richelia sp. CSU_2_1]|nr:helix-turn-helix transcriptional regulator [Microcoleus sp. SU_5_6]NJR24960.1 helix-turn-helix transcriptional regulator [Richelia sp. CSU_2_1]